MELFKELLKEFSNYFQQGASGIGMLLCVIVVIVATLFAILKLQKFSTIAIPCIALLSFICAIPFTIMGNFLVNNIAQNIKDENAKNNEDKEQLILKTAELERIKEENKQIKNQAMNISNLTATKKMILLQTSLSGYDFRKDEITTDTCGVLNTDFINSDGCSHVNHIIYAAHYDSDISIGVDFDKIRIRKVPDKNVLLFSGVKAELLHASIIPNIEFSELRTARKRDNGKLYDEVEVLASDIVSDKKYSYQLAQAVNQFVDVFRNKLNNPSSYKQFYSSVEIQAQKLIKAMFSPYNMDIEFTETIDGESYSLSDFLDKIVEDSNNKLQEKDNELNAIKLKINPEHKSSN